MPVKPTPPIIRFERKFIRGTPSECWLWNGAKKGDGYGNFGFSASETVSAHVASFRLFVGQVPRGLYVCHRCDVRLCVNPNHLFIGTPKQNQDDMRQKRRDANDGNRRLKLADVPKVVEARRRGVPLKVLALQYGVSETCISLNARGLLKNYVPGRDRIDAEAPR